MLLLLICSFFFVTGWVARGLVAALVRRANDFS